MTEAYDYLRLFLTARAQYEFDTPTHASILSHGMAQRLSLIEEGWPVRVRGGTNSIYDIIRASSYFFREDSLEQYNSHPKTYKVPPTQWTNVHINKRKLVSTHLEDEDIPLFYETFDHVYFGSALEQEALPHDPLPQRSRHRRAHGCRHRRPGGGLYQKAGMADPGRLARKAGRRCVTDPGG